MFVFDCNCFWKSCWVWFGVKCCCDWCCYYCVYVFWWYEVGCLEWLCLICYLFFRGVYCLCYYFLLSWYWWDLIICGGIWEVLYVWFWFWFYEVLYFFFWVGGWCVFFVGNLWDWLVNGVEIFLCEELMCGRDCNWSFGSFGFFLVFDVFVFGYWVGLFLWLVFIWCVSFW